MAVTQGSGSACASLRRTSPWAIIAPPLPGLRRRPGIRLRQNNSNREAKQTFEPAAIGQHVCGRQGKFIAFALYRLSGGGASAFY